MDLSDFEIIVVYVRNRRVEEEKNIRLNILFPFDSKEVKICFNVCFFFLTFQFSFIVGEFNDRFIVHIY